MWPTPHLRQRDGAAAPSVAGRQSMQQRRGGAPTRPRAARAPQQAPAASTNHRQQLLGSFTGLGAMERPSGLGQVGAGHSCGAEGGGGASGGNSQTLLPSTGWSQSPEEDTVLWNESRWRGARRGRCAGAQPHSGCTQSKPSGAMPLAGSQAPAHRGPPGAPPLQGQQAGRSSRQVASAACRYGIVGHRVGQLQRNSPVVLLQATCVWRGAAGESWTRSSLQAARPRPLLLQAQSAWMGMAGRSWMSSCRQASCLRPRQQGRGGTRAAAAHATRRRLLRSWGRGMAAGGALRRRAMGAAAGGVARGWGRTGLGEMGGRGLMR